MTYLFLANVILGVVVSCFGLVCEIDMPLFQLYVRTIFISRFPFRNLFF